VEPFGGTNSSIKLMHVVHFLVIHSLEVASQVTLSAKVENSVLKMSGPLKRAVEAEHFHGSYIVVGTPGVVDGQKV